MFTEQCFLWGNTTPPCFSSLALICPSWQFPSGSPWFHILMPPFSLPHWNLWSKTRLPFGYWLWNAASVVCSQIHGPHTKRGSPWGTPISSAVYTHKSREPGPFGEGPGWWAVQCGCGNRHCLMETLIWVLSDMCDGAYYPDDQAYSVWQLAI